MNSIEIKETHLLNSNNFIPIETDKKRIILGNTNRQTVTIKNNVDFSFFNILKNRYGGTNLQTPMYSIDVFGQVYRHFPDEYYSNYISEEFNPGEVISIVLHNEGGLYFDTNLLKYTNWSKSKYRRDIEIINIEWRGYNYWAPYTDLQYKALTILLAYLSDKHDIPFEHIDTITSTDQAYKYNGTISKSNLTSAYIDLTPAFDWKKIK